MCRLTNYFDFSHSVDNARYRGILTPSSQSCRAAQTSIWPSLTGPELRPPSREGFTPTPRGGSAFGSPTMGTARVRNPWTGGAEPHNPARQQHWMLHLGAYHDASKQRGGRARTRTGGRPRPMWRIRRLRSSPVPVGANCTRPPADTNRQCNVVKAASSRSPGCSPGCGNLRDPASLPFLHFRNGRRPRLPRPA